MEDLHCLSDSCETCSCISLCLCVLCFVFRSQLCCFVECFLEVCDLGQQTCNLLLEPGNGGRDRRPQES